jgi:AcrR family transcriptional regulator
MTRERRTNEPSHPRRKRDAAATRAAILASARRRFAEAGYDGAGVREIARGAGVTAMLVNRYFGSKEELFAEVVADIMAQPILLTSDRLASAQGDDGLAEALVAITAAEGEPLDGFRIMCRSAASATAAAIGCRQIDAHYHRRLTSALRGRHAPERAALLLAIVAGVQMMRQMIGLTALKDCPPRVLAAVLRPVIQQLWRGDEEARPTTEHQRSRSRPARTRTQTK